jgi:hypothetical protein
MREDDVVRRLATACHTGHVPAIEAVLDSDAIAICDSGGHGPAPILPVHGAADIARLLHSLLSGSGLRVESVNGRAGLVVRRAGQANAVIAVTCAGERALTLWVVLNPAKLQAWHR